LQHGESAKAMEMRGVRRKLVLLSASSAFALSAAIGAKQNQSLQKSTQTQNLEILAEAQTALEQSKPQDAVRILEEFLGRHPKNSAARVLLGRAFEFSGANDRAEAEFQRAIADSANNYEAMLALAELFTQTGQPDKAEPVLANASKASGRNPRVRIQWAIALARLHRFKEARAALAGVPPPSESGEGVMFHRLNAAVASGLGDAKAAARHMELALALKQDDIKLRVATSVAELQAGNWARAAELAEPVFSGSGDPQVGLILLQAQLETHAEVRPTLRALRLALVNSADELTLRQSLAEILVAHGEYSESIEDLQRASQLEPARGDLLFNLALAQFKAGHLDDALGSIEKRKEVGDSAELEDLLGDVEEAQGDYLAAIKSYQAAVSLAPSEENYRVSLAVELIRHRNYDAAKVVLRQAEGLWPASWRIKLALGMAEYISGMNEDAVPTLLRAAELSPQPESALDFLGNIELSLASEPDAAAVTAVCKYADNHPKNGKVKFYCGAMIFRKDNAGGDKSRSEVILEMLRSAAQLIPHDPAPRCQMGRVYRWVEQWEKALQEWRVCAQMDPELAEAHFRLTEIYHHLGQQEMADREKKLFEAASKRLADENASREEAIRSFLFTIQTAGSAHKPN
jgi:tetratricopeptide (TPR) repeat protein